MGKICLPTVFYLPGTFSGLNCTTGSILPPLEPEIYISPENDSVLHISNHCLKKLKVCIVYVVSLNAFSEVIQLHQSTLTYSTVLVEL